MYSKPLLCAFPPIHIVSELQRAKTNIDTERKHVARVVVIETTNKFLDNIGVFVVGFFINLHFTSTLSRCTSALQTKHKKTRRHFCLKKSAPLFFLFFFWKLPAFREKLSQDSRGGVRCIYGYVAAPARNALRNFIALGRPILERFNEIPNFFPLFSPHPQSSLLLNLW